MPTTRMNGNEYESLRALFGLCSEWKRAINTLERRFKGIDHGWRDARLIETLLFKLLDKVVLTIESDQLKRISKDLKNTHVKVSIGKDATDDPMYTYMPARSLKVLINTAAAAECAFCDKNEGEARKCPLRIAMNSTLAHDLKTVEGCEYRAFGFWIGDPRVQEEAHKSDIAV